jgi:hypothetical protein
VVARRIAAGECASWDALDEAVSIFASALGFELAEDSPSLASGS